VVLDLASTASSHGPHPRCLQGSRAVSSLIPLTHLLEFFRAAALKGAPFTALWSRAAVLLAWFPVAVLFACRAIRRMMFHDVSPQIHMDAQRFTDLR
jgi:hypothetical protein